MMSLWVIRELWREAFERPMPPLKGLCLRCHVKPVQHRPAISSAPDLESLFLYSVVFCLRPCQCNLSHKVSVALSRARCYLPPTMCMCVLLSNFECIEHFIVLAQRLQPQPCVCGDLHVRACGTKSNKPHSVTNMSEPHTEQKKKNMSDRARESARATHRNASQHMSLRAPKHNNHTVNTHTHTHTHTHTIPDAATAGIPIPGKTESPQSLRF